MAKKITVFIFGIALLFSLSVSAATGKNDSSGHTAHMKAPHSTSTKTIDSKTAKNLMNMYMDDESQGGYELKNFTDDGSYFRADVLNSRGTLMNEIVVNKKNGNVYFTKKR